MPVFETEAIPELQTINGVTFPKCLKREKLIITGPPGTGKSTILKALGGWPEEGYLDISMKDWWRSPTLSFRPREIHFGLPFVGYDKAVPVYELDSLDDSTFLELDLFRIPLPPPGKNLLYPNFRGKYVFEFLLPSAEATFALRKKRGAGGTHHVDQALTLERVQEELGYYQELALYFHRSGMTVYVRDEVGGNPKKIKTPEENQRRRVSSTGGELHKQLDQIKLRQQILNRSWSGKGNRELLELFVEIIPVVLQVERCSIFVRDSSQGKVRLYAGTGLEEGEIELDLAQQKSVVGRVISTGEYMVIEDMQAQDGFHQSLQEKTRFETRNELCVPIKSLTSRESIGAILALNKAPGAPFLEEDREFLESVARHLQTAIESLYLRQDMMDFTELMASRAGQGEWLKFLLLLALSLLGLETLYIAHMWGWLS